MSEATRTMTDEPTYAERVRTPREVTLAFRLSSESLRRVLDKIPKAPATPLEGLLRELTAGFMTICEDLRQLQNEHAKSGGDSDVNPVLWHARKEDLQDAGRLAQMAISRAEEALLLALKACDRAR